MSLRLPLLVVALLLASCGKGDRKTCETACRNFYTLAFWHKWDPEIAKEPADQQMKLRRQKLAELEAGIARGVDQCVESCQRANDEEQYTCLAKAKTWDEAHACAETEEESQ